MGRNPSEKNKNPKPTDVYNYIRLNHPELNIQPLNKFPCKIEYSHPVPVKPDTHIRIQVVISKENFEEAAIRLNEVKAQLFHATKYDVIDDTIVVSGWVDNPNYVKEITEYNLLVAEFEMITRNVENHNRIAGELYNQNRRMIRNLTSEHKELWISVSRMLRGPKKKSTELENV